MCEYNDLFQVKFKSIGHRLHLVTYSGHLTIYVTCSCDSNKQNNDVQ